MGDSFWAKEAEKRMSLKENKTIWAVGGGKGGTGKSFVSSSLAIQLASQKDDVLTIDADLGGPNLHTFLGIKEAKSDLGDFVTNKVTKLAETAIPTSFANLKLIKGSENVLFMANLNHYKKLRLIRQIKTLEEKRVIIDIGTGSSYNSLDFFLLSNPGILVITPEPTSIENTYYFLKSCIVRILKLYMDYYKIGNMTRKTINEIENDSKSIYSFFNTIISYNKSLAQLLYRALKNFKPCLVMNKVRSEKDLLLGYSIADVARKFLAVELSFVGSIPYDERVHWSLNKFVPFTLEYPDSQVTQSIKLISEKLVEYGR